MIIDTDSRSEAVLLESKIKKRGINRFLEDLTAKSSGGGAAR